VCKTDKGTPVQFVSDQNDKDWYHCHGLTCGGTCGVEGVKLTPLEMPRILKDGWDEIDCNKLKPSDIIVWYDKEGEMEHSAWVAQSCTSKGGTLAPECTYLVTKNGDNAIDVQSLEDLIKVYKGQRKCYRLKT
jgi:hypothetical protein